MNINITIGERVFMPLKKSRIEAPPEISGFYKKMKHGVRFFDRNQILKFYLATEGYYRWLVTASRLNDGRIFYMFALNSLTAKWLGLDCDLKAKAIGFSSAYDQRNQEAERVWAELNNTE